jgi:exopolyphosphatase/guanosine-5'-triphosphate,3'-diphosphate pyrophosphatase
MVRDETGIELTVIGGEEEARLIYLGARAALNLSGKKALIVDIGGGSIELIVGDAREAYFGTSLKLGVLRLLDHYQPSDPITPDQRLKLAADLHRAIEPAAVAIRKVGFDLVAMTSGTARAVGDLIPGTTAEKPRTIDFKDVYALEEKLCVMRAEERAKLPNLDAGRVDSIIPGVILVRSLLEVVHADSYVLCEAALREGLVADYALRNGPGIQLIDEYPDLRRRSIVRLQRRCNVNRAHADQVARLALDLFRGLRPLHDFANSDGELLEFAALVHDIGFHIAASKHHKHGAYLIENAELQGFSVDEIQILAQAVRYHRKATPKEAHAPYSALSATNKRKVQVMAALLRLADGLDRGYAQVVRGVRCRIGDKVIEMTLSTDGEAELELWGARRKRDLAEEIFGRKIKFTVEPKS